MLHRPALLTVSALAALVVLDVVCLRAAAEETPAELIRLAVIERMGEGVEVAVTAVDGLTGADVVRVFREARPDPSARLGRPIRVTLVPEKGTATVVTATVRVIGDRVVVRRAVSRGATVEADDVELVRAELVGTPIRRLPTLDEVTGARALRPIAEGAIVLPGFVLVPRAVDVGDRVTVVASVGAVQVTGTFIASDSGAVGDLIRVMNPDTRRYVRGRIVSKGVVEVIYEK